MVTRIAASVCELFFQQFRRTYLDFLTHCLNTVTTYVLIIQHFFLTQPYKQCNNSCGQRKWIINTVDEVRNVNINHAVVGEKIKLQQVRLPTCYSNFCNEFLSNLERIQVCGTYQKPLFHHINECSFKTFLHKQVLCETISFVRVSIRIFTKANEQIVANENHVSHCQALKLAAK